MKRQIRHPGEAKNEILKAIPKACTDETAAVKFIEKQRWGDVPTCPHCGKTDVVMVMNKDGQHRNERFLWRCHACHNQFTVRVGTIMEDSRIPLRFWCHAFWRACSSKKGVSALQISRECNLSYKSALFLMHRIRWAMAGPGHEEPFKGTVEVDETYVGGKPRNRHESKHGLGTKKTPVVAIIEREGEGEGRAHAFVMPVVTVKNLRAEMDAVIDKSARLCTDEAKPYRRIGKAYRGGHGKVMHSAHEYVDGDDHINTAESFFALIKRGMYGTFHAVSRKHLPRYVDEFAFRWSTRKSDDGERVRAAIVGGEGKRLMCREPVSKTA